jgi:predicted nucleic acid-binding Zn ribbon protein
VDRAITRTESANNVSRSKKWGRTAGRPSSLHTNLLQKPYGLLATTDSLSFRSCPCANCCSAAGRFVAEHCKNEMKQFITVRVLMTVEIMNAATLSFRWTDCDRNQSLPIVLGDENPYFSLGIKPRERHCPSCDSIVYSRRHRSCSVCGETLPKDCLFTATEAENVEMLLRTERQRHRAWLKKTTGCRG